MVIISKAMALTGIGTNLTGTEIDALLGGFSNGGKSSGYAREGVASCIESGIVTGKGNNTIAPQADIGDLRSQ